jgi:hypothetical protein
MIAEAASACLKPSCVCFVGPSASNRGSTSELPVIQKQSGALASLLPKKRKPRVLGLRVKRGQLSTTTRRKEFKFREDAGGANQQSAGIGLCLVEVCASLTPQSASL